VPRRNLRAPGAAAPDPPRSLNERTEQFRGDDYRVRSLRGAPDAGPYRCPGCDQLVSAGAPHVVAWPAHDVDANDRRHWHTPCWANRDRRAAGPRRTWR
jgi:hypothetical protein